MNADKFNHYIRDEHRAWDTGTMHEVITQDSYFIEDFVFNDNDVVIDIGANIGFFSGMVHEIGCKHVVAVEASPMNFVQLVHNVGPLGVRCINMAVWRSDELPGVIRLDETVADGNTGGISVVHDTGPIVVHTVSLDALLAPFEEVRFLKVDCEGSEYPILMTSKHLRKVLMIAIEVHPVGPVGNLDSTVGGLAQSLVFNGYNVRIEARQGMPKGWAYIWAERV